MVLLRQALWGCYRSADAPDRALPLEIALQGRHAGRLLTGGVIGLDGWVRARDLTDRSALRGTLWLAGIAVLRYEIAFDDAQGAPCWLQAAVSFEYRRPFFSLSRLRGTLTPARGPHSEVELRYDYRRDCRSLLSFQPEA